MGQLDFVLAESETPEGEVNVADALPHDVDSLGVLTEKVAPLAPPPLVTVELVTDPASVKSVTASVPLAPFVGSVICAEANMVPQ